MRTTRVATLVAAVLWVTPVGGFVGPPSVCGVGAARSATGARVVMLAKKKKGGKARAAKGAPAASAAVAEVEAAEEAPPAAPPALEEAVEIFPIPAGAWERRRVAATDASFDALLAAAEATSDDDDLAEYVQTNRDMLDYRWLYRLTGELLRAQNTGAEARSAELRELRGRIIRLSQRYDAPLFKQIAEAEGRLGQVLGLYAAKQAPPASQIAAAAGQTGTQVFAFWVVVVSAISAWEAKLLVPSVTGMAQGKLDELAEVLGALEAAPGLLASAQLDQLNTLVASPNQAMADAAVADATGALAGLGLDDDAAAELLRKLGCLSCQASRHAFQAYNPFVQKTAALYDVLRYGRVQPLSPVDIKQPPRAEYTSNLVKLAVDAEEFAVSQDTSVELFW